MMGMVEEHPLAVVAKYQTTAPVNLNGIARDLNLPVISTSLSYDIAGQIVRDKRTSPRSGFVIYINSDQHENRQRFTLAHEIAHFILHRDLIESGIVDDTMYRSSLSNHYEVQANRMAADILMPIRLVKAMYAKFPLVDALAGRFQVSSAAMKIRLDGLGLTT